MQPVNLLNLTVPWDIKSTTISFQSACLTWMFNHAHTHTPFWCLLILDPGLPRAGMGPGENIFQAPVASVATTVYSAWLLLLLLPSPPFPRLVEPNQAGASLGQGPGEHAPNAGEGGQLPYFQPLPLRPRAEKNQGCQPGRARPRKLHRGTKGGGMSK